MYNIYIYLELLGTVSPHKILGEKQWPHGHCRFWHCLQITSQKWLQSAKHWICQENVVVTELCPFSLQCKGWFEPHGGTAKSTRKERQTILFSSALTHGMLLQASSSHTPHEIMENQRESEPTEPICLPHRGTAMGHCDFLWHLATWLTQNL